MINAQRAARLDDIEGDILDILDITHDDLDADILDILNTYEEELLRHGHL